MTLVCDKHGYAVDPDGPDEFGGCPQCHEENSPQPITQAEQAVIEAAREWEKVHSTPIGARKNGHGVCLKLAEAVRALDAPKPVRPEDVEPGTRFRFDGQEGGGDPPNPLAKNEYMVIATVDGSRLFLGKSGRAYRFADTARIIPIAPE